MNTYTFRIKGANDKLLDFKIFRAFTVLIRVLIGGLGLSLGLLRDTIGGCILHIFIRVLSLLDRSNEFLEGSCLLGFLGLGRVTGASIGFLIGFILRFRVRTATEKLLEHLIIILIIRLIVFVLGTDWCTNQLEGSTGNCGWVLAIGLRRGSRINGSHGDAKLISNS